MTNNAQNVTVGRPALTGGCSRAPLGTVLPTDATTALAAAFVQVGYVTDNGLVEATKVAATDILAWGGELVRKVQTSHDLTYTLQLMEVNGETNGIYYGAGNVTTTPATVTKGGIIAIKATRFELEHSVWCFDILDNTRTGRILLPDGQVTDRSAINYIDKDVVSYPIVVSAYADALHVKAYIYWDDGILATA